MVYRRTPSVVTRLEDNRARILAAARDLVAEGGWRHAHVATVAEKAGVATGTVYRYFPSKAELFAEVLANVSRRERDVVAAIVDGDGTPAARLQGAVQAFAKRALQGRRLALRHDRRALRAGDRRGPARVARGAGRGVRAPDRDRARQQGAFRDCDPRIAAACVVGAFMEALVGPLAPEAFADADGRAAPDRRDRRRLPGHRRQAAASRRRDREDGMTQIATSRATHAGRSTRPSRPPAGTPSATTACSSSLADRHRAWVKDRAAGLGAHAGDDGHAGAGAPRQPHTPELKTPRPLRQPHRLGRVPSGLARADGARLRHEVHALAWTRGKPGGHVARGVLSYIWNQIEHGVGCPTGMTYAAYPGLVAARVRAPGARRSSRPRYDKRPLPLSTRRPAPPSATP